MATVAAADNVENVENEIPENQRPTITLAQLESSKAATRAETERKTRAAARAELLNDEDFVNQVLALRATTTAPEGKKEDLETEITRRVTSIQRETERKFAAERDAFRVENEAVKATNSALLRKSKDDAIRAAAAAAGFKDGVVSRAPGMFGDLIDFNPDVKDFSAKDGDSWSYGADGRPKTVTALLADLALLKENKDLVKTQTQQGTTASGKTSHGKMIITTQAQYNANLDKVMSGEAIVNFK